jgi:hypothetical protein
MKIIINTINWDRRIYVEEKAETRIFLNDTWTHTMNKKRAQPAIGNA